MKIARTIAEIRECTVAARAKGLTVRFVPTMGALHRGHGTLVERARAQGGFVVVSIFVNPIQFDRKDDYEKYATNFEADRNYCESLGVDAIFAPAVEEMYPEPSATFVDVPEVARYLCGASRPGHFRGVATVVAKLFNMVQPHAAYFGEKDAQQLAVIQRMVSDLNFPIEIIPVETVREPDGLALSSRNQRLTPAERQVAPRIYQALTEGRRVMEEGERSAAKTKSAVLVVLEKEPSLRVDYCEIVDASGMPPVETITQDVRLAVAAWLGSTRLIDNILFRGSSAHRTVG